MIICNLFLNITEELGVFHFLEGIEAPKVIQRPIPPSHSEEAGLYSFVGKKMHNYCYLHLRLLASVVWLAASNKLPIRTTRD